MPAINIFNSIDHLEPRCKKCGSKIVYGITTYYDDEIEMHKCSTCNEIVE